jgi:hypothetical protein
MGATKNDFAQARILATRAEILDKLASGRRADWSLLGRLVEADIALEIEAKVAIIGGNKGISDEEAAEVLAAKLADELIAGLYDGTSTDPMSNAIDAIRRRVYRVFVQDHDFGWRK